MASVQDFGELARRVPGYLRRTVISLGKQFFEFKPKPLILTYHRVADDQFDPWGLAISPAHFEEHLDLVRRKRQPFSLDDFVRRLLEGTLPATAIAVTFDDGYVDNLTMAKPRLAAADVPATVFLATGFIIEASEFWWDELARLMLTGVVTGSHKIKLGGRTVHFRLEDEVDTRGKLWRGWRDPPLTARREACLAIWKILRDLESRERENYMREIRTGIACTSFRPQSGRPMTQREVRDLLQDGLIAIGAHTVSHPALPALNAKERRIEIAASKQACESLIGDEIRAFSYPFGILDANVRAAVREAGFALACAAEHGPAIIGSDTLALPRIHVPDLDGDAFDQLLNYASMSA